MPQKCVRGRSRTTRGAAYRYAGIPPGGSELNKDGVDKEALLKVEDLARILNCGRTKAWELVNSHEIRTVRIGRLVRIEPESLTDFLSKYRR
jgi:excisionase family DNA binding protein